MQKKESFFHAKPRYNSCTNKPAINTIKKTMFVWWLKTNILKKHKCSYTNLSQLFDY